MTLSETRKLGIEFERRVQTMIPEKEYLDKLDTETIYAYLNSYQDKYIHDIYRNLDQIKSGSKMSAHVEAVLQEMLRTKTIDVNIAKNYTGDITDSNGLVIVENGRSVTYPLDPSFYMYVRSVSNVTSTYSFKSTESQNGKQRPIRVLPNELVSQSDIWRLLETPHNSLRILRYPAASIGAYEDFDSTLVGSDNAEVTGESKFTEDFDKTDVSFTEDAVKVYSYIFEYDTTDSIWYDSRSGEIHFSLEQQLLPADFYTNNQDYFVVINETRNYLSESDISQLNDYYEFEELQKYSSDNTYSLSISTGNKFEDSNNQIRLAIYKRYNTIRIGTQYFTSAPDSNEDHIYIYVNNTPFKGEYVASGNQNQYAIRINQVENMSKPLTITTNSLNKINIVYGATKVNLPTLNVIYDQYTTPVGIKIVYYAQPQRFDLMTSTRCELPMDAFDDLVTGAVDLYVQYVAGAEANKRRIEQARQQAAKQQAQQEKQNSNDEE